MVQHLSWPQQANLSEIVLGLERIKYFMHLLGDPHLKLSPVIHVAGTNGKGSTTAFIQSLLTSKRKRVHVYTSPHLLEWNERFQLYGQPISDELLCAYSQRCQEISLAHSVQLSHFEALTAIAFLAFSEHPSDFIVLETGLGGRLDATNIIPNPLCTVLTPIDIDHTEYLGNTVEAIAAEKCGIIKHHAPCIVGKQSEAVNSVIEDHAHKKQSLLYRNKYEWNFNNGIFSFREDAINDFQLKIVTSENFNSFTTFIPEPALSGSHQHENLALAVATLTFGCKIRLDQADIEYAASNTKWPGRLERVATGVILDKLPNYKSIWLDVAHNAHGARALENWIIEEQKDASIVVVVHLTRNRLYSNFLSALLQTKQIKGILILEAPQTDDLAYVQEQADLYNCLCKVSPDFESILNILTTTIDFFNTTLLFCGSHHLVGLCQKINTSNHGDKALS